MTFREFLEANPNEAKRASSCKNIQEFKKLADEHGITYADEAELQSAYSFIKGEDMLKAASGGAAKTISIEPGPLCNYGPAFDSKKLSDVLKDNFNIE